MASAAAVRAISAIVTAAVVIVSGRPGWTLEFLVTEIRTLPGRVGYLSKHLQYKSHDPSAVLASVVAKIIFRHQWQ